ncbi:MAG: ComF family protein [Patescibacteria group bacterium]
MAEILNTFKEFLLNLLYPKFCLGCKKEGSFLCYDCKSTLDISEYRYCLCNKPLRIFGNEIAKCNSCQDKKLSGLYFALPYKERFLTKKLIYQFKYEPYLKGLAKDLAGIIAEHLFLAGAEDFRGGVLAPVPMELSKQKERGYNQSEELAKELGQTLNAPVVLENLIKTKKTEPQMKLSAENRRKNLFGAFKIKNPAEFAGKKIYLVDDVYTTGSTMEECARVLRQARTKEVWGICIAREG